MPHDHGHAHIDPQSGDRRVSIAIWANGLLTVAQIVGGILSGSLALIADALHNFSDMASLVIAFFARKIARRPADKRMTFGYGRAEVVAAMVNYTTLILLALYLAAQGVERLFNPVEVTGWVVVVVAAVALVVDTVTAWLILRLSKDSMNMRAAFLHNLADAMGSVAVIVAGTLILLYDWRLIDPIVTLLIAAYILWHAAQEIVPVIRVLMLGAPEGTDVGELIETLEAAEGVEEVHHVHLWRMQEHETAFEAHVVIADSANPTRLRHDLKSLLQDRFGIGHTILEFETCADACPDAHQIGH